MHGYCIKCSTVVEMKDPESFITEDGKPASRGTCPKCGFSPVFRIGGGTSSREETKTEWSFYTRSTPTGIGWSPHIPARWLRSTLSKIQQNECVNDSRVYTAIIKGKNFIYKATFSGHGCSNITLQSKRR